MQALPQQRGKKMPDFPEYPYAEPIPPPPDSDRWSDILRWVVFVMNNNDPQMHFASSCLTWVFKTGGLTERQSAACSKLYQRISKSYEAGALDAQADFGAPDDYPVDDSEDADATLCGPDRNIH
jgi:hypothetical protein